MSSWLKSFCLHTSLLVLFLYAGSESHAQDDRNQSPINYDSTEPTDNVAKLSKSVEQGDTKLRWDAQHGWLPSLLEVLDVPQSSQTLVFSKTSKQNRRIRPSSPRAIYFNDNIYVGFVQQGDFLEVAAVDDNLGAVFYTVDQTESKVPRINRATHQCMSCHETHKTQDVPGFLVRSVYPKKSGHPDFKRGTNRTDHTTPLKDRFGGWYVTGNHGNIRHRGNVFIENGNGSLDREAGANLNELPKIARPDSHLQPTSDIVALMLLEHQTQFHNFVTRASYTARKALHHQAEMNKLFDRPANYRSDSTTRRLNDAAEQLVKYLFFSNEAALTAPIRGNSEFKPEFESRGIRTKSGDSLRDLDLDSRLLKNPCSYLIHTESFLALPESILSIVKSRMLEILSGKDTSKPFSHLSQDQRQKILDILVETHPLFQK